MPSTSPANRTATAPPHTAATPVKALGVAAMVVTVVLWASAFVGIRAIGRVLGASPAGVLKWIRKEHVALQRQMALAAPTDTGTADIIEMDEIYTYVQKNSSGR